MKDTETKANVGAGTDEASGAPTLSPEEAQQEIERLREEVENLERTVAELKENEDKLRRSAAFYENRRRQAERELEEERKYGAERLLKKLLPIKDNLERALEAAREDANAEAIREGIEMVLKQMDTMLESEGVRQIETVGEPFDPNLHEAVAQTETDEVPANHVVSEIQRGYLLNDRLLRAASVLVAAEPTSSDK